MDLHGLAVLIRASRRARADGGSFALARPAPCVLRLLELVRADGEVRDPARRHGPARRSLTALPFSACARSPTRGRSAASGSPTAWCSRRSPASATGSCASRRSATAPAWWSPRWSRASASCTATSAPSREFLRIHPDEHPVSMQLFGHDAAVMREAAAIAAARRRRPDRPQHGLPGAQGLQDRCRARRCSTTPTGRWRSRARRGEGSGLPVTVKLRPGREPGDRAGVDAGAAAGGGGRRGRHRLPPAARLAAALGRARLRARARAGRRRCRCP